MAENPAHWFPGCPLRQQEGTSDVYDKLAPEHAHMCEVVSVNPIMVILFVDMLGNYILLQTLPVICFQYVTLVLIKFCLLKYLFPECYM